MPQSPVRRPAAVSRPPQSSRRPGLSGLGAGGRPGSGRPAVSRPTGPAGGKPAGEKAEHDILFQQYFKSACPEKTYAVQLKRANNGNQYLVLTEGKRDGSTGDVRKTRVFVYSEDFGEFFRLLQATAVFIRANPVPDDVKKKRARFWAKRAEESSSPPRTGPDLPTAPRPAPARQAPSGVGSAGPTAAVRRGRPGTSASLIEPAAG